MRHWKETVIKSENIKWKRPPIKTIKDGKLDIFITIPLTDLFEAQAKVAFAGGMMAMLEFHVQSQIDEKVLEVADITKLFNDCGLPEVARQFTEEVK